MKTKIIILLLLAFSFQGCMLALSHSCESANSLLVWGGVDGKKDLVGKYELAYVFDRDTVHMDYKDYSSFNSNEERDAQYIHKAFNLYHNQFIKSKFYNLNLENIQLDIFGFSPMLNFQKMNIYCCFT